MAAIRLGITLLLVLLVSAFVLANADDDRVTVATSLGKISGFKEESTEGREFYSFQSVPYAKPPIGELRLKDPVPPESWSGVRDGSIKPLVCPQLPFIEVQARKPVYHGKEDCLYLSIFTSKPGITDANLPVMVFIHGGAFFAGGIAYYSPYVMMNKDIVFILVQYRLGILGFLSMEDDVIPGNFGLKDQVMALQWIQHHIHNFGGDKSRVTIFGESAGGASVHFHLISPYSEGLFSGGILQSGTLLSPWAMGGAYRAVAEYTGELFGCPSLHSIPEEHQSATLLSCLQTIDVANLTLSLKDHIHWNYDPVLLGPRVDGDYIPDEPALLMKRGQHNKVNLISGINADEGGLFTFPLYAFEELKSDLKNNFDEMGPASLDLANGDASPVDLAHRIFNYYVGGVKVDEESADDLCRLYGDWQFNHGHDVVAKLYKENDLPNKFYLYELNYRGQRSFGDNYNTEVGKHWISHVDELYYLFTGKDTIWNPLEKDEDLKLRNIITTLWFNFASTGNPTPDESLGFTWVPISKNDFRHLSLTPTPSMENDRRDEVRKFLESLPTRQNFLLNPELVSPFPDKNEEALPKTSRLIQSPTKYGFKDEL